MGAELIPREIEHFSKTAAMLASSRSGLASIGILVALDENRSLDRKPISRIDRKYAKSSNAQAGDHGVQSFA